MVAGLNHAQPFGAQSPEQIAKDYGGNKQKIAQAMQLGVVDPTVGTLAGMFIDRMAAGAQQTPTPQGTVASQVFNPQTPPAQAPGGAGLGALPAAPMGAGAPPPQMPMPPQSPQDMQPMSPGMADGGMIAFDSGGLASLPVPDDMFNSSVGDSDTQHYADGAEVRNHGNDESFIRYILGKESGGRDYDPSGNCCVLLRVLWRLCRLCLPLRVTPVMASVQREMNSPEELNRVGRELALKLRQHYGNDRDALMAYNWGPGHVDKWIAAGRPADMVPRETRNYVGNRAFAALPKARSAAPTTPTIAPAGFAAAELPYQDMSAMQEQLAALTKQRADDMAAAKRDRRQAGWAALGQRGLAMLMPQGTAMAEGGSVPGYATGDLVQPALAAPAAPAFGAIPTVNDPMDAYKPDYLKALQGNISGLMPQSNKYADLLAADAAQRGSEESQQKDRKEAANQALMNFGLALMASKNPNFLGSLGEAGMPAVAGLKADLKDIKKDAHDALVESAQAEGLRNDAANRLATLTLQQAGAAAQLQAGNLDRKSRERMEELQRSTQLQIEKMREKGENYRANLAATAAGAKDPFALGVHPIKTTNADGTVVESTVDTRTNKKTGTMEYYSDEFGGWLPPEYANAMRGRPGALDALKQWAAARDLTPGINPQTGGLVVQNRNGDIVPVKASWLAKQ